MKIKIAECWDDFKKGLTWSAENAPSMFFVWSFVVVFYPILIMLTSSMFLRILNGMLLVTMCSFFAYITIGSGRRAKRSCLWHANLARPMVREMEEQVLQEDIPDEDF